VRCIAEINSPQRVIAGRQRKLECGLAFQVQRSAAQLQFAFTDDHSACCRKPILAYDGHISLRVSVLLLSLHRQRGLGGQSPRVFRCNCRRRQRQRDTQSCNQLKPQTAA